MPPSQERVRLYARYGVRISPAKELGLAALTGVVR